MRVRAAARRIGAARRGAAALEFALIVPAFVLLCVGLMETGRVLWTQNSLLRAVQAAARCGAVDRIRCPTPESVRNFAAAQALELDAPSTAFTADVTACGSRVTAALPYAPLSTIVPALAMTIRAEACFPR